MQVAKMGVVILKTIISYITAILIGLSALSTELLAEPSKPEIVVKDFQNLLISAMKSAKNKTIKERYNILYSGIDKAFHFPLMTRIVIGNYWTKANRNDKHKIKEAFLNMSASTLATLFNGYDGEYFEFLNTKVGPSNTKLVVTNLVKSNNSKIKIIYVTYNFNGGWRIIDVIVDSGISELKVRQSEYQHTLKKFGITGLIKELKTTANKLLSE